MSVGAAIIGSDTEPVREVVRHRKTGLVTPFFDVDRLVTSIDELLKVKMSALGLSLVRKLARRFSLVLIFRPYVCPNG